MPWLSEELDGRVQEADGGFGLLIGQHLGKGHAGVVVDGHMQGQEAGMLLFAAQPAIAAQGDVAEAGHAFDIQMQEVAGRGVLVALDRRRRVQIAPSAQPRAAQDAAHRGRTQAGAPRDLVAGHVARAEEQGPFPLRGNRSAAGCECGRELRSTRPVDSADRKRRHPLGGRLGTRRGRRLQPPSAWLPAQPQSGQRLSTTKAKSGILMNVHSLSSEGSSCSSQPASPVQIEWTTS